MPGVNKRLMYVVNVDWFFLSHRLPIALAAMREGYEVHVAVGITDRLAELRSYGFTLHPLRMRRGNSGIADELAAFFELFRLFKTVKPDLVHLVTIKPVLWGGIASRLARVPAVVAAISGLGFVFVNNGWRAQIRRFLVGSLYRIALGRDGLRIIFQNHNDLNCLVRLARLPAARVNIIRGSGVDLARYTPTIFPDGTPLVIMACRLIADKGVWEFVKAAHLLHERGLLIRFGLVGEIDPDNPASLSDADMDRLRAEGIVELWGMRTDMESVLAQAHVFALPSYYGEGLPKVLIEAAACGRPVVTTDMPGCRDAVDPGMSALLVSPRDSVALADAIQYLIVRPECCKAMGEAGRRLAEQEFDINAVVSKHLHIYEVLIAEVG